MNERTTRRQPQTTPQSQEKAPRFTWTTDDTINLLVWLGIGLTTLVITWNLTGCLELYDTAGPYARTVTDWCA